MKLVTITITLALLSAGMAIGHEWGFYQGKDAVQSAMMVNMADAGLSQMGGRK